MRPLEFFSNNTASESSRDEKKRDASLIDDSDLLGGGFHLLLFEMIITAEENVFLLDIDGAPTFGDGGTDRRVMEVERLVSDMLTLGGWIKADDRLETIKEYSEVLEGVCGVNEDHSGLCKLRLAEDLFERNVVDGTKFARVIPSRHMCENKDALVTVGYFAALDYAQCEFESRT